MGTGHLDAQKGRRMDKWELGKIALKLKPEIEAKAKGNMSPGGQTFRPSEGAEEGLTGVSLGIFIFLSIRDLQESSRLCAHEYGHTIQCLLLGPLYWVVVALPSVIWYHFFAGYRKKRGIPYDALFANAGLPHGAESGSDPAKNLRHSKQ